jgi:hypothetical protein
MGVINILFSINATIFCKNESVMSEPISQLHMVFSVIDKYNHDPDHYMGNGITWE